MNRSKKKALAILMAVSVAIPAGTAPTSDAKNKVKFNKTKISVKVGKKAKVTLKNGAKKAKVTWSVSNKKVIKLVKKNKKYATVKGVKKGNATLKATYKVGKVKKILKCKVKVEKDASVKKDTIPDTTVAPSTAPTAAASTAPTAAASTEPTAAATTAPTAAASTEPTAAASTEPTAAASTAPTAVPTASATPAVPTKTPELIKVTPSVDSKQNYSYFNDYTLGYDTEKKEVVAYKGGNQVSLEEAGAKVYDKYGDNVFEQQIEDNTWNAPGIKLTAPLQYTTTDGKAHDINSMLTNFDFIADPTALDNSDVDGKLYVYGTNEGFEYVEGKLINNKYNNHSLSILSTSDMVNWTDEGLMDNGNLTNVPDSTEAKNKVVNKWTTKAWAPSALKIDGDGDGEDEFYIFYTDGGGVGYVRGDSPVGPWYDDLGKKLFTSASEGCQGVKWCFDPAVLADDKGNAYVYFGGGNDEEKYVQTGRVCKLKFEKGTGKVSPDGLPQTLDTFCFFEDGEINQIDGKYIYSYCTNWDVKEDTPYVGAVQIAAYISSDPMNIAFFPDKVGQTKYTDDKGVAHNFLGTILDNPSKLYGETYNNHHHMQNFKGHNYIFYHSTALSNALYRDSKQYRNLHVNEIDIDMDKETIKIEPSYEGATQLENFNPYVNTDGSVRYINATTSSKSAGVKSLRDDRTVMQSYNGSPMVLDQIDTGDWTKISGVDFGENGLKNVSAELAASNAEGQIEVYLDDPTVATNRIARIGILDTKGLYAFSTADVEKEVKGVHDVYFVFRGNGYNVASWAFSEKDTPELPDLSARPTVAPIPTMNPNLVTGWNADKTEYAIPIREENVSTEGGAIAEVDMYSGQASLTYNGQYPGVWFSLPQDITDNNFQTVEITYETECDDTMFGSAIRYSSSKGDEDISWSKDAPFPSGAQTKTLELNFTKNFNKIKIFTRANPEDAKMVVKSIVLKRAKDAVVPTGTPKPTPLPTTETLDVTYGWNEENTEYTLPLNDKTVTNDAGCDIQINEEAKTATITYDGAYPGIFLNMPEELTDTKFSSIVIKYDRLGADDKFGCAPRYLDNKDADVDIQWANVDAPFGPFEHEKEIALNKEKDLYRFKIFGNGADQAGFIIKAVILKR
ncbi:MAG: carbohydrate-binding protein [Eubacterium sp.]